VTPLIEGAVAVHLTVTGDTVRAARVAVQRPTSAAGALAGRTVAEALRLVPLLYSICGTAQGVAAVEACEAALGRPSAAPHHAARALLVLGETASSHAWQACMDWPRLLGEAPRPQDLAPLRAAATALAPALYPRRDAITPGGGALRPDRATLTATIDRLRAEIARVIFDGAPLPATPDGLAAWAADSATPAGRLLARVLAPDLAGFGASDVAALPDLPPSWFGDRLAADSGFSARPHRDGAPAVTGPLARTTDHPMVASLLARSGPGLAAHFAARLVELAGLPERMAALLDHLVPADPAADEAGTGTGAGAGAGMVETARGRLAHWVRIADGRIADYRTVAPTEWNFAADGPLARGLTGAPANPGPAGRAALLVAALDPCVRATITVEEG